MNLWDSPLDGTEFVSDIITETVRSDGSRASKTFRTGLDPTDSTKRSLTLRNIQDVGLGARIVAFPVTGVRVSDPINNFQLDHLANKHPCEPPHGWKSEAVPQPDSILGYRVVKHYREPNHLTNTHHEMWVAPDLDCQSLREIGKSVDPLTGESLVTTQREVLDIELRTREDLFAIPAGYTEKPVDVAMKEVMEKLGVAADCDQCPLQP